MNKITNTQFSKSMGERIMLARKKKGMNQESLSKIMGIPRATISSIERGSRRITAYEAEMFRLSLGVLPEKKILLGLNRMVKEKMNKLGRRV